MIDPKAPFMSRLIRNPQDLYMFVNDTPGLQIIGVKHAYNSGQILILDLSVYKESFYYNFDAMIATKKAPQNIKQWHPQLRT